MPSEPTEGELPDLVSNIIRTDVDISITIVEQDGATIHILCSDGSSVIEVMTEAVLIERILVLNQLHVDGSGRNSFGLTELRACVRAPGRQFGVSSVEIRGGIRITGGNPGHVPRIIRI